MNKTNVIEKKIKTRWQMTIGEFSKKTKIPCSTLRYYEEKGLITLQRDSGNRRIFEQSEIEWVKFLQRLKNTGMSLKDMKTYANLRYQGESTILARLEILKKHAIYVAEQKLLWEEYDTNLQEKIRWYEKQL